MMLGSIFCKAAFANPHQKWWGFFISRQWFSPGPAPAIPLKNSGTQKTRKL
jgi:hypothetical protein